MAPQSKGSYFNYPNEQRAWKVTAPSTTLSAAALSAAAFFEALRIATRPCTTLSLDAIYRTPGIDFRGVKVVPSLSTSPSTATI